MAGEPLPERIRPPAGGCVGTGVPAACLQARARRETAWAGTASAFPPGAAATPGVRMIPACRVRA